MKWPACIILTSGDFITPLETVFPSLTKKARKRGTIPPDDIDCCQSILHEDALTVHEDALTTVDAMTTTVTTIAPGIRLVVPLQQ